MATLNGTVNTINSDLKTNQSLPTCFGTVEVLGYFNPNDGGGGQFYWDATSVETSDDATIVAITGVTTGRWKRVMSGPYLKVEWFGAIGVDSGTPTNNYQEIQNCLNYFSESGSSVFDTSINNGVIDFPGNKIFGISATLEVSPHQTINFNNSKIQYIGTGGAGVSCIQRKDINLDKIVPKITLNDLLLDAGQATIGVNFYGISFSTTSNARIITNAADSIAINLVHGNGINKQCYFNLIENVHIMCNSKINTIGIYISGSENVSGANHNRIVGGLISGNDSKGIFIENKTNAASVGNFISNVDFESADGVDAIAIKCNCPLNYFENNHIESYEYLMEFNARHNIITGLTKAGSGTIVDNTGYNIYNGVTNSSDEIVSVIGAVKNDYGTGTRQVLIAKDTCNMIFENTFADGGSKNYALVSKGIGQEFEFKRGTVQGANPVTSGNVIWKTNDQEFFELMKTLKINTIPIYPDNDAAVAQGWAPGFLYRTNDGTLKIVY